jgi:hypothetical protein
MSWTHQFIAPIVFKHGRSLVSLSEARAFIKSLPIKRRSSEKWLYAEGLLAEAAVGRGALPSATVQLKLALKDEGLL